METANTAVANDLFTELCTLVEGEMTNLNVPGVALGLLDGDKTTTSPASASLTLSNPWPLQKTLYFRSALPPKPLLPRSSCGWSKQVGLTSMLPSAPTCPICVSTILTSQVV